MFEKFTGRRNTGVVNHDIEAPKRLQGHVWEFCNGLDVVHVALLDLNQLGSVQLQIAQFIHGSGHRQYAGALGR